MRSQMTHDASDGKWLNILGQYCKWCGKRTPLKYLFPVLLSVSINKKPHRTMHCVCLDCIAFDRRPKGFEFIEAPFYNNIGKRVNENEKVRVAFSVPAQRRVPTP